MGCVDPCAAGVELGADDVSIGALLANVGAGVGSLVGVTEEKVRIVGDSAGALVRLDGLKERATVKELGGVVTLTGATVDKIGDAVGLPGGVMGAKVGVSGAGFGWTGVDFVAAGVDVGLAVGSIGAFVPGRGEKVEVAFIFAELGVGDPVGSKGGFEEEIGVDTGDTVGLAEPVVGAAVGGGLIILDIKVSGHIVPEHSVRVYPFVSMRSSVSLNSVCESTWL